MTPRGRAAAPSLIDALRSRRTLAVSLLSFASGLPLGLVWYAIPDWMAGTQLLLAVLVLWLAGLGERPQTLWIVGA